MVEAPHGFALRSPRRWRQVVVLGLVALSVAGCGEQRLHAHTIGAGSTEATETVATTAATITGQELGYLSALRPASDRLARAVPGASIDDGVLLAFGYGVCRRKAQTGETWSQVEEATPGFGGAGSEAARWALVMVRAARANICG